MWIRPRIMVATIAVALVALASVRPAKADVLEQVPADAWVVLKINNLDSANKKVARFAARLGLDQMEPGWADPLGWLEKEIQIGKGVDRNSDLAIVMIDPASVGGNEEEAVVALVPVTDFKEFLANFKEQKADGELTVVTPHEGRDLFVAQRGKYAAMSPGKVAVSKQPAEGGLKLEASAAKEAAAKDAIVYANLKVMRARLLKEVTDAKGQLADQAAQGLEQDENAKKFAPFMRVMVQQYVGVAERFLQDARAATLGMSVTDDGITTSVMADFDPESYLGKLTAQVKNSEEPLLGGLPERAYFAYGGMTADPKVMGQLMKDMLEPIVAELLKVEDMKVLATAFQKMTEAATSVQGATFGFAAPTGLLGQESLLQQIVVMRGDSNSIAGAQREVLGSMKELFKLIPENPDMKVGYEYKQGAKTVEGVALDSWETKFELNEEDPNAAQIKQMMQWMYGPAGMSGVLGAVNDKTAVVVAGANDELIAAVVKAAKAGDAPLSKHPGVLAVSQHLPKERFMVGYVAVDVMVTTAVRYANGLGLPLDLRLPPNLPPVGMAGSTDGSAVKVDTHVPMRLIEGLVAAGIEARRQMENPDGL